MTNGRPLGDVTTASGECKKGSGATVHCVKAPAPVATEAPGNQRATKNASAGKAEDAGSTVGHGLAATAVATLVTLALW